MVSDMTRGKPLLLLLRFALPLILSTVLQQFYILCDSYIVGHLIDTTAFAAIGSSAYLYGVARDMVMGCTQGFSIAIAQRFGAGDREAQRRFFSASVVLSVLFSVALSAGGLLLRDTLLKLVRTPPELTDAAGEYLSVMWTGLVIAGVLNMALAALYAIGDSRTPLIVMAASSVANIALDLLFTAVFRFGVRGVAAATVIAQMIAAVFCLKALRRAGVLPDGGTARPCAAQYRELIRLGVPAILSRGVNGVASAYYQAIINGFGAAVVTGMAASGRYFDLLNIVGYGMEGAVGAFVGQNAGIADVKRIHEGTHLSILIASFGALAVCVPAVIFARPMIALLVRDASDAVLWTGVYSLRVSAVFIVIMDLLCIYRAAVQGMGNTFIPMLSGFAELAIKFAAVTLLPRFFGVPALFWINVIAWVPVAAWLMRKYTDGVKMLCK